MLVPGTSGDEEAYHRMDDGLGFEELEPAPPNDTDADNQESENMAPRLRETGQEQGARKIIWLKNLNPLPHFFNIFLY